MNICATCYHIWIGQVDSIIQGYKSHPLVAPSALGMRSMVGLGFEVERCQRSIPSIINEPGLDSSLFRSG